MFANCRIMASSLPAVVCLENSDLTVVAFGRFADEKCCCYFDNFG